MREIGKNGGDREESGRQGRERETGQIGDMDEQWALD
jgi:hypothetical protein